MFARLRRVTVLFLSISWLACTAVDAEQRQLNLRIIQSGHSLTDPIPKPLQALVSAAGYQNAVIDRSTIPGSPMDWRWNNEPSRGLPNARTEISKYDVLVLTERVALSGTLPWHNSPEQALIWFNHAWTEGNDQSGAETVLYATWVGIDSGPNAANPYKDPEGLVPFRERLDLEMDRWEKIQTHVNKYRVEGSPPMRMIPGPILMAALYDAVEAGKVPDINNISYFFKDNIHLNELGAYFVSLAHYAVIYKRDPRGLPGHLLGIEIASDELVSWMQETVWRVVSEYEGAGLRP